MLSGFLQFRFSSFAHAFGFPARNLRYARMTKDLRMVLPFGIILLLSLLSSKILRYMKNCIGFCANQWLWISRIFVSWHMINLLILNLCNENSMVMGSRLEERWDSFPTEVWAYPYVVTAFQCSELLLKFLQCHEVKVSITLHVHDLYNVTSLLSTFNGVLTKYNICHVDELFFNQQKSSPIFFDREIVVMSTG